MAHIFKKKNAPTRDSGSRGEGVITGEFDDELTEPVSAADSRRDGPVLVGDATRYTTAGDHTDDELTAPVLVESDAQERVDDDPREGPVAVPEHPPADAPDDDSPLEPGSVLRDRFEIVELVHTGGMSRVYKAIDRRRHPPGSQQSFVAIKMLRPSVLAGHDAPEVLEREAAAAQHLSHPNIVNIFDFDTHDEHFFLVMEWLEGNSVKELLQRTTGQHLAPEFALQIIYEVAKALEHAHLNDIVHADINLSNVFVTDTKQIKLLDFGVSRRTGHENAAANDELIWVTHKYASPEVLSGSVPDFADDIFALGCVAYRLLGGRHPFAGLTSLQAQESGLILHPDPGLSAHQWRVLKQTLSFARADRPTSASVFLELEPAWPEGVMHRVRDVPSTAWLVALSVVAVAAAAGLWSLLKTSPTEEAVAVTQPAIVPGPSVDDAPGADASAGDDSPSVIAGLDERLRQAAEAMSDERYVAPEDYNARQLYVEALAIDPGNPIAAAGLREISDVFVQRASSALSAGDLSETTDALAVAADTDPDNPAIAEVRDLLAEWVDAQPAPVGQESAEGDPSLASATAPEATTDPLIAEQELSEARGPNTASSEEQQLVEGLARVEDYIAARRLTLPPDDSAYRLLLELREQYGNDDRLRATINRFGEALLTEAAIAAVARDDAEAARLLGIAESVNADPAEIERISQVLALNAREELESQSSRVATPVPAPESRSAPPSTEAETAPADELAAASAAEEDSEVSRPQVAVANPGRGTTEVERPRQRPATEADSASTTQPSVAAAPAAMPNQQATRTAASASTPLTPPPSTDSSDLPPGSAAPATNAPTQPRVVSLSDMKIEKYVAPVYPRSARRRGLTGNVVMNFSIRTDGSTDDIKVISSQPGDVFVSSATKAIRKWRFEPPGEVVTAQVNFRFEEE